MHCYPNHSTAFLNASGASASAWPLCFAPKDDVSPPPARRHNQGKVSPGRLREKLLYHRGLAMEGRVKLPRHNSAVSCRGPNGRSKKWTSEFESKSTRTTKLSRQCWQAFCLFIRTNMR